MEYAREGLGDWAAYIVGWLYWYFWVGVIAFEAVVGGAMRSRRAPPGGQIVFEVTQDPAGDMLTLIIRVEDYTTRLIDLLGRRLGIIVYHGTQGLSHKTLTLRFLREQAALLSLKSTLTPPSP